MHICQCCQGILSRVFVVYHGEIAYHMNENV